MPLKININTVNGVVNISDYNSNSQNRQSKKKSSKKAKLLSCPEKKIVDTYIRTADYVLQTKQNSNPFYESALGIAEGLARGIAALFSDFAQVLQKDPEEETSLEILAFSEQQKIRAKAENIFRRTEGQLIEEYTSLAYRNPEESYGNFARSALKLSKLTKAIKKARQEVDYFKKSA